MSFKKILTTAALAACGLATSQAFAITNGGFEANTGDGTCATGWTCNYLSFGEEAVSYWNSQMAGSNLVASPFGGNVLAAWDIDQGDIISQTLTGLTVGAAYYVTFDEASADRTTVASGPGTVGYQVSVGGSVLGNASVAIPGAKSSTPWSGFTYSFVATATSEVLQFLSESSVPVAPEPILVLDGVNVAPVPEPSTWALTLAGVAVIGGIARRRRKSTQN